MTIRPDPITIRPTVRYVMGYIVTSSTTPNESIIKPLMPIHDRIARNKAFPGISVTSGGAKAHIISRYRTCT